MENEQLVARIKSGIDTAENMLSLWQQNKGFIHQMAVKYSNYAEVEDLKQEAYFGLCKAVEHYDADMGVAFIDYAAFWIKQAIQRYIDNCGSVVRIPVGARGEILKYKKIANEYRKYYGCEPSDSEMRGFLGVSKGKLESIKKSVIMGQIQSLDEPISEEGESSLVDMVSDANDMEENVIKRLDTAAMKRELWIAVDKLPKKQTKVIRERYANRKTLQEVGEVLGLSIGTVRQAEEKAIRTLRIPSRCRTFKAYYEEYLSAAPIHHVGVERFNRTWTSEVEQVALKRIEREEDDKLTRCFADSGQNRQNDTRMILK